MNDAHSPPPPEPRRPRSEPGLSKASMAAEAWRWPLTLVVLAVLAVVALGIGLGAVGRFAGGLRDGLQQPMEAAVGLAEAFRQGRIEETFRAAIPEVTGAGAGRLEVAKATVVESFTSRDEASLGWGLLSLGETVSEIEVPVTYRYYLSLSDDWRIEVDGQTCVVYAPRLRPTLPPAIHTDRMRKRSREGWARFNAAEQMAELESGITPTLVAWSRNPKHLALVRDEGRKTVARFIRTWLLQEDHWRSDRFRAIVVLFPEEVEEEAAVEARAPVLELETG